MLIQRGKFEKAKEMLEKSINLLSEILGEEHENTLSDKKVLAVTYICLHQLGKAEELQLQVLRAREKAPGAEHPDMQSSIASLAVTYSVTYMDLNRLSALEELRLQVLKARRKVLGAEYPDTLRSMTNLAVTYPDFN